MRKRRSVGFILAIAVLGSASLAQNMPGMSGMEDHPPASPLAQAVEIHDISGTDVEPASTPAEMLMHPYRGWMLMLHGQAFISAIQQSGPRGADKFFSTDWIMGMAQKKSGNSVFTLRSMLSLDPATVSDRRYPELFQQGETAYGSPIVDGQHPHDLFMEIAALFDFNLTRKTTLSFYAAPVGDPAMGPPAYPHRASASEDPVAPLGHHLQDSTHIADDVLTAGLTYRAFRLEASGFHGREPDEYRWNLDTGALDSWSARASFNPAPDWSLQYSIAGLHSPEVLARAQDVRRMTASLIYNRRFHNGNWASMILWGRNRSLRDGNVGNSYLLESTLQFHARNNVWTRIENVDRTTELLQDPLLPADREDRYFARVQAYTIGFDRDLGRIPHLSTALGAQVTFYGVPAALTSDYGPHPVGGLVFLRLRLR